MSRRAWAAVAVLGLWAVGLGFLVRRELFRPDAERFREMGLRVTPGTMFYALMRDGRHVGFASSAVDTTDAGITVTDYFVADLPTAGGTERTSGRIAVVLSRSMRLQRYLVESSAGGAAATMTGTVDGDSVVVTTRRAAGLPADTQRVRIDGPLLMPTLLPLAIALTAEPTIGRQDAIAVFDPTLGAQRVASVRIAAETVFVVHDSATFDAAANRWAGALPLPTRAWQVESDDTTGFSGWIDDQGRVVRGRGPQSLELVRMPYELAYQNWQLGKQESPASRPSDRSVVEATTIAAGVRADAPRESLRVRLTGVDLGAFDLSSPTQRVTGDTVAIIRADSTALDAHYALGHLTRNMPHAERARWSVWLRAEPAIETMDPGIRRLASRLRAGSRNPREVVVRLHRWVADSLGRERTAGVASARAVLERRAGDVNDHTRLFVALARAASVPARAAAGFVRVGDTFHYHAWPEVYLGDWVAVDPAHDRLPADASLVRFVVGGLDRQAEMVRLIGTLDIEVLDPR